MNHIVLKELNINNIIVKNTYSSYRLYYDGSFTIKGIPLRCYGKIKNDDVSFKFYIEDKSSDIFELNKMLMSSLKQYSGFINKDSQGNYLYFTKNYYTNSKVNDNIEYLHLNIKYINKNNYNTVIHII